MSSEQRNPSLESNMVTQTLATDHTPNLEGSTQATEGPVRKKLSRKSDSHLRLVNTLSEELHILHQQADYNANEQRIVMGELSLTLQNMLPDLLLVIKSIQRLRWNLRGVPRRGPRRGAGLPHLATSHPHRPNPGSQTPRKSILIQLSVLQWPETNLVDTAHFPWTPIASAVSAPTSANKMSVADLPSGSQHETIN
jgi:hypothetical protein